MNLKTKSALYTTGEVLADCTLGLVEKGYRAVKNPIARKYASNKLHVLSNEMRKCPDCKVDYVTEHFKVDDRVCPIHKPLAEKAQSDYRRSRR